MLFCFNDTATTETYTDRHHLALLDAPPIARRLPESSSARLAAFAIDWPSAALGPVVGTSTATFWRSASSGPVGFSTGLGGPACPGLASRPPGVHAARIEHTARVSIVRAQSPSIGRPFGREQVCKVL